VTEFVVLDPDIVEDNNLNRLVGATDHDVQRQTPKVEVATRVITGIRPDARVVAHRNKWQEHAALLRDCTAIFGCVDSFSEREQLEIAARRYLIPYFDVGMDVHQIEASYHISGQVVLSMPGERCLRCFGILTDETLAREAQNYGVAGGRPQVVWPNAILASTAIGLFVQLVTPWHDRPASCAYLEYDGNQHTMRVSNRFTATTGLSCRHHAGLHDLGDPFWIAPGQSSAAGESWLARVRRILLRR
jgi:hypothetical protein